MNPLPVFPAAIYQYVRSIFRSANRRACEKLAAVPNCPEQSLDMTVIEHLSRYSGPRVVAPGWTVRIDVYYLGGLRHFLGWEIADIGLFVFAKQGGHTLANKVAVLQSKRLYPDKGSVIELEPEDFKIGIATLLPSASKTAPRSGQQAFPFTTSSKYHALLVDDNQYKAIHEFEKRGNIPVHYLLYNPWVLPVTYTFPIQGKPKLGKAGNGASRVAPAAKVRDALASKPKGYTPTFSDLQHVVSLDAKHSSGWRLEHFAASLVMRCQEGRLFGSVQDDDINALFYRRSGPIAAAVAVTIEQSDEVG